MFNDKLVHVITSLCIIQPPQQFKVHVYVVHVHTCILRLLILICRPLRLFRTHWSCHVEIFKPLWLLIEGLNVILQCMYVCMYITYNYTCTCVYTCTCMCMYVCLVFFQLHVYEQLHVRTCMYMYIRMWTSSLN